MKLVKFYLNDTSYFSTDEKIIHSDTLFSAVVNNYSMLYDNIEEFIHDLKISSLFFGFEIENKNIYTFPKPIMIINSDISKRKEIKGVKFVSKCVLEDILNNYEDEFNLSFFDKYLSIEGIYISKEELLLNEVDKKDLSLKVFDFTEIPKNTINRFDSRSEGIFYEKCLEIKQSPKVKPFMFFLIDNEITTELKATLNLLCEEGIGANRTIGNGIFKNYEIIDFSFNIKSQKAINLSLIYPSLNEVDKAEKYELTERGGFIFYEKGLTKRKKSIRMIKEGSIFSSLINGENILNQLEDKKIYHYGKAFLIGGNK